MGWVARTARQMDSLSQTRCKARPTGFQGCQTTLMTARRASERIARGRSFSNLRLARADGGDAVNDGRRV